MDLGENRARRRQMALLPTRKEDAQVHQSLQQLRRRRATGDESGFTLIELLIVIVILGILAAIVVFAVQNLSSTSAQASCQSDFKTIETAVETYKAQMGNYPSGSTAPKGGGTNTDNDGGASPAFTAGSVPAGGSVNAAGTMASELLVGGATAPNTSGTASVGPWLKDVPGNSGHYGFWVANDGTGEIQVLDSVGKVPTGFTNTQADCNLIG